MGKTHVEQLALAKQIDQARSMVIVNAQYHHYKGEDKIYTVTGLGFLEATDELCVIYRADYGEWLTFIRPLNVWLEEVEWHGTTVPRFTKI